MYNPNRYSFLRILSRTFDKLVSFGYNKAEGGELVMKQEKRYLALDLFEWRLARLGSVKYYAQICLQKLKNEASTSMTGGRQPSCQP